MPAAAVEPAEPVVVQRIDPDDGPAFDAWYAVLLATDEERWPDLVDGHGEPGWSRREAHALTSARGGATEYHCLSALDASGATVGIGLCEAPQRDNRHSASIDVRVRPDRRRRGIGTAVVAEAERRLAADGRTVVNGLFEVPTAQLDSSPAAPFARHLGFEATLAGNRRHLALPLDPALRARLGDEVARASGGYRTFTFVAPWPEQYLDDQCELNRRMSTDQPSGDEFFEEEVWDAERVAEMDRVTAAQGLTRLVAVAEDIDSGHLVAFSSLALPLDHPAEAWQWATLVLREHRGHRLGLAVKLANLDSLAAVAPAVALVITGNAQENAPMIAVNDMLGFEVAATGTFWQKRLAPGS
jgi:GNAT superfamily N-acetyltransferase